MAKYRIKNTAKNREVYLDGKPPRTISLAPGEERADVEISDEGAAELRGRKDTIKDHKGIIVLDGPPARTKKAG